MLLPQFTPEYFPHFAVVTRTSCTYLQVHSESCVVMLLTAWVKSELHPVCSQPQLNALARNIRVEHLSPLYLHCVLPELAWFRSCSVAPDGGRGNSVMAAPSALRMLALQHALGGQAAVAVSWKGPPAWVSGRRSGTSLPTTVQIDWQMGPRDLEALQAARPGREPLRSPTSSYLNGVFYTLEVETGVAAASAAGLVRGGVTLGICLCPDKGIMAAVFGDTAEDNCSFLYSADLWAGNKTFGRRRISSSRIGWPNIHCARRDSGQGRRSPAGGGLPESQGPYKRSGGASIGRPRDVRLPFWYATTGCASGLAGPTGWPLLNPFG